jgi:hypothetical protein
MRVALLAIEAADQHIAACGPAPLVLQQIFA